MRVFDDLGIMSVDWRTEKWPDTYKEIDAGTIAPSVAVICSLAVPAFLVALLWISQRASFTLKSATSEEKLIRRIYASLVSVVFSVILVWAVIYGSATRIAWPGLATALGDLGIKREGFYEAMSAAGKQCALFYLGSIARLICGLVDGTWMPRVRLSRLGAVVSLKDQVLAPLIEEIIFRGCIVRLLFNAGFSNTTTILFSSVLFGLAHLFARIAIEFDEVPGLQDLLNALAPTTYTSLFGAYSAHLILKTGHLSSCICAHTISNILGNSCFEILSSKSLRITLCCLSAFVLGLAAFTVSFS